MERKIFEELLELKRLQIRAGRANEQLMVKRLSEGYSRTIQELVGMKNYNGPYTFKEFEKYLYSKWFDHVLPFFLFFFLCTCLGKYCFTCQLLIVIRSHSWIIIWPSVLIWLKVVKWKPCINNVTNITMSGNLFLYMFSVCSVLNLDEFQVS